MRDACVEAWIREALNACEMDFLDDIITYNFGHIKKNRLGVAIGVYKKGVLFALHIRLSKKLWPIASIDERRQCIFHEVCHLVTFYNGDLRHGHHDEWQRLMLKCGYSTTECHHVGMRRSQCGCSESYVSEEVFNNLLSGRHYICTKCRQYVSIPNVVAPKKQEEALATA